MRKWFSKKILSLLLAFAMIAGICSFGMETANAAEKTTLYEMGETDVTAGQEISFPFSLSKKRSEVDISIFIKNASAVTVSVCDSTGKNVEWAKEAFTIGTDKFAAVEGGYYGYVDTLTDVPAGDYTYKIAFTENTSAMVGAYAAMVPAKISQANTIVTEGFTKNLFVSQGAVSSWESSKTSVAKVDETGKITGKKPGKSTITATLADGEKVSCTVTVKENAFTDSRLTASDVKKNRCSMEAYHASFDEKGNLVVKVSFVNNTANKITSLKNVQVTVKDKNGKTIGAYKAGSLKLTVPANSVKRFHVTIKKSELKKKTADLRNAEISCEGKYVYKKK